MLIIIIMYLILFIFLILCAVLNYIVILKTLPLHYYENIIYDYKDYLFLISDINKTGKKNKLNISNLNKKILK